MCQKLLNYLGSDMSNLNQGHSQPNSDKPGEQQDDLVNKQGAY
jgi:hypothetical protein